MGTNYYCKTGRKDTYHSFDVDEILHVGKSSYGWYFTLQIYPEKNLTTLRDWIPLLQNGVIRNEYGEDISYDEMLDCILRQGTWNWDFSDRPGVTEHHIGYDTVRGERGLHYVQYDPNYYNEYICRWCTLPKEDDIKGLYRYEVGDFC